MRWRVCVGAAVGVTLLTLLLAPIIGTFIAVACLVLSSNFRRTPAGSGRLDAIELAGRHAEAGNLQIATQLLTDAAGPDDAVSDYARAALAVVRLRQGEPRQAVWLLSSLIEAPTRQCNVVLHTLEHALSYSYAVAGALEIAERRCLGTIGLRHASSPLRYVLLCKRRRFNDVGTMSVGPKLRERLLPTGSALADAQLGWHGERVVALLSGFAHCRDAASESPAARRRLAEFLVAARPTYAGEYDYLQADWPELRAFLERHADQLAPTTSVRVSPDLPRASTRVAP